MGWRRNVTGGNKRGFTIVELLIVIVVIAILAAITIVAFNGLQQRARNSAKIAVVENVARLVQLYRTGEDQYPATATRCLTADDKCTNYNGTIPGSSNTALVQALSKYGTVPAGTQDNTSGALYGIEYLYNPAMTLNSMPNPLIIMFWLDGTNQDCTGIAGMISVTDDSSTPSGMKRALSAKSDTGTNQTRCYMMFSS